jgi:phage-related protein
LSNLDGIKPQDPSTKESLEVSVHNQSQGEHSIEENYYLINHHLPQVEDICKDPRNQK